MKNSTILKQILSVFFILTLANIIYSQDSNSTFELDKLFELKVDSIEQKVTLNNWGSDTSYYLHYQINNIATDTLTFKTNTCFYYNHSTLTIGKLVFALNLMGGCYFNSHNVYELAPGESLTEAQWITFFNMNKLEKGDWDATLFVPVVKDDQTTYRVDGRGFVENEQYLVYEGKIKIMNAIIDNRKRKRKKRST
jgi:hypothetical protein